MNRSKDLKVEDEYSSPMIETNSASSSVTNSFKNLIDTMSTPGNKEVEKESGTLSGNFQEFGGAMSTLGTNREVPGEGINNSVAFNFQFSLGVMNVSDGMEADDEWETDEDSSKSESSSEDEIDEAQKEAISKMAEDMHSLSLSDNIQGIVPSKSKELKGAKIRSKDDEFSGSTSESWSSDSIITQAMKSKKEQEEREKYFIKYNLKAYRDSSSFMELPIKRLNPSSFYETHRSEEIHWDENDFPVDDEISAIFGGEYRVPGEMYADMLKKYT